MNGFYNDLKAFRNRVGEELLRARRYATFVSLVSIDLSHISRDDEIENFGTFSDFMVSLRRFVRESTRDTDLLTAADGRIYLLLVDTPLEGAHALSGRLQAALRYFICDNIKSPLKWRAPMKEYSFPVSSNGTRDLHSFLDELE